MFVTTFLFILSFPLISPSAETFPTVEEIFDDFESSVIQLIANSEEPLNEFISHFTENQTRLLEEFRENLLKILNSAFRLLYSIEVQALKANLLQSPNCFGRISPKLSHLHEETLLNSQRCFENRLSTLNLIVTAGKYELKRMLAVIGSIREDFDFCKSLNVYKSPEGREKCIKELIGRINLERVTLTGLALEEAIKIYEKRLSLEEETKKCVHLEGGLFRVALHDYLRNSSGCVVDLTLVDVS